MKRKTFSLVMVIVMIFTIMLMTALPAMAAPAGRLINSANTLTGTDIVGMIHSLPPPWNTIAWVLIAVAGLSIIALFIIFRKKPFVKRFLFKLVCDAEAAFGSKTGQRKFNEVYIWFCAKRPLLALLLPESLLEKWIEEAVEKMKKYLQDGGTLNSTIMGASNVIVNGVLDAIPATTSSDPGGNNDAQVAG